MSNCEYKCTNGRVFLEALGGFVPCPSCSNIEKLIEEPQEDGTSIYDKLNIPKEYRNCGVSGKELFMLNGMSSFSQSSIKHVSNLLEQINQAVYSGVVLRVSAYIHVPNIVDIKRFVYGVQKLALEKNLGVTPYTSLNTLAGLIKARDYSPASLKNLMGRKNISDVHPDILSAADGYRFFQKTGLNYSDFTDTDLCIVSATAATTDKGWTALADLLDVRSTNGLPTYVIGYWHSKTTGSSKSLHYLLSADGSSRLNLLTPYDCVHTSSNKVVLEPPVQDLGIAKSGVSAGLNIKSIMG